MTLSSVAPIPKYDAGETIPSSSIHCQAVISHFYSFFLYVTVVSTQVVCDHPLFQLSSGFKNLKKYFITSSKYVVSGKHLIECRAQTKVRDATYVKARA